MSSSHYLLSLWYCQRKYDWIVLLYQNQLIKMFIAWTTGNHFTFKKKSEFYMFCTWFTYMHIQISIFCVVSCTWNQGVGARNTPSHRRKYTSNPLKTLKDINNQESVSWFNCKLKIVLKVLKVKSPSPPPLFKTI